MFSGAADREKRAWQHTLAVCTQMGNVQGVYGKQGKPIDYLYEQAFGNATRVPTLDELSVLKDAPKTIRLEKDADTN